MADSARYANMSDPVENPQFRRIWTEPTPIPTRWQPKRASDRVAAFASIAGAEQFRAAITRGPHAG